jgi:hypothetical protein
MYVMFICIATLLECSDNELDIMGLSADQECNSCVNAVFGVPKMHVKYLLFRQLLETLPQESEWKSRSCLSGVSLCSLKEGIKE